MRRGAAAGMGVCPENRPAGHCERILRQAVLKINLASHCERSLRSNLLPTWEIASSHTTLLAMTFSCAVAPRSA
jgi:hypothetical protein